MSPKHAIIEDQLSTEIASMRSLAFETLSEISSLLCKSSMKSFRLVCSKFCDVVTPFLFNSIFVSARHFDLEVSNSVALKFPNSIKTLTFGSSRHFNPERNGVGSSVRGLLASYELEIRTSRCRDRKLHSETAIHLSDLYCKLSMEARRLHTTGVLHAHLCHLLNTLPKLRQIVITDKRRRQDVSWYQEALMDKKLLQRTFPSPANNPPRRHNRFPMIWSNLSILWRQSMPQGDLGGFRGLVSRNLHNVAIRAPAEPPTLQSVGCHCFERNGDETLSWSLSSSLIEAGSDWMPGNPWSVIMIALHESKDSAVDVVSIGPENTNSHLPVVSLMQITPDLNMQNAFVLAHLTKLELRLGYTYRRSDGMSGWWTRGTPLLSAAPLVQSLTIDFISGLKDISILPYIFDLYGPPVTIFEMLLGGCKLPSLSKLHLRHLSFLEEHLSAFLQESPELHDLSLEELYMAENEPNAQPITPLTHRELFTPLTRAEPQAWGRLSQRIKETLHQLEYFHLSDGQLVNSAEVDRPRLQRMIRRFMFNG